MEKIPSNYIKDYWIFAFSPTYKREELSRRHMRLIRKLETMEKGELKTGKWLIFLNKENVDKIWNKIKLATEEDCLGVEAKVSTAKPKSTNIKYEKDKHVICVYRKHIIICVRFSCSNISIHILSIKVKL